MGRHTLREIPGQWSHVFFPPLHRQIGHVIHKEEYKFLLSPSRSFCTLPEHIFCPLDIRPIANLQTITEALDVDPERVLNGLAS